MNKIWMKIVSKNYSKNGSIIAFLFCNCIMFCLIGFVIWLVVSRKYLNTLDWAICFAGYPGMFFGYIGGIIFLLRNLNR